MKSLSSAKTDGTDGAAAAAVQNDEKDTRSIGHWAAQALAKKYINAKDKRIFNNARVVRSLRHHSDRRGAEKSQGAGAPHL